MMPEVIACLRKDLARLQPDFILATGDICSTQTRDAMFAARDLMDSLHVPYYPMGGNHDFVVEQSRAWFLDAFQAHLPTRDTVYTFAYKNLRFCVLDPWWKWSDGTLCPVSEARVASRMDSTLEGARWAVPPHQFAWLEDELASHPDVPTMVATHYPAVSIPGRMCRDGMQDAGHLDNGGLLIEILMRHPQVKAVFSGHVHMHFVERTGQLAHVVTGALPEFPTEYRDVSVYEDRLEIKTCGLSNARFAQRSLLPGRVWTAGEASDRSTVIPLE